MSPTKRISVEWSTSFRTLVLPLRRSASNTSSPSKLCLHSSALMSRASRQFGSMSFATTPFAPLLWDRHYSRDLFHSPLGSKGDCTTSAAKVEHLLLGNDCRVIKDKSGKHLGIRGALENYLGEPPALLARKLPTRGHLGLEPLPWLYTVGTMESGGTVKVQESSGPYMN